MSYVYSVTPPSPLNTSKPYNLDISDKSLRNSHLDAEFLSVCDSFFPEFNVFDSMVRSVVDVAKECIKRLLEQSTNDIIGQIEIMEQHTSQRLLEEAWDTLQDQSTRSRLTLLCAIQKSFVTGRHKKCVLPSLRPFFMYSSTIRVYAIDKIWTTVANRNQKGIFFEA